MQRQYRLLYCQQTPGDSTSAPTWNRGQKQFPPRRRLCRLTEEAIASMLIFISGALLGVIIGGTLCVCHLRREIAADIGPQLKRVQLQLDTLETQLNLAIMTRYTELSSRPPGKTER
jgi:hypothetical protein